MKVRLLTDGGYDLDIDAVGKIYEATRSKYGGYSVIMRDNGEVLYFYADEVEIIQEHIYFLEAAEDKTAIKIIVVSIIATILCIAAIIYVIF